MSPVPHPLKCRRQRQLDNGLVGFGPVELALVDTGRQATGIASLGPMPVISGGTRRTAKHTERASGVRLEPARAS